MKDQGEKEKRIKEEQHTDLHEASASPSEAEARKLPAVRVSPGNLQAAACAVWAQLRFSSRDPLLPDLPPE